MLPKPKFLSPSALDTRQNVLHNNRHQNHHHFNEGKKFAHNQQASRINKQRKMIACDFDDCRFKSNVEEEILLHKKIGHIQLLNKYSENFLMNSPEEIARWREERRRKFPKVENVSDQIETIKSEHYKDSRGNKNEAFPFNNRSQSCPNRFQNNQRLSNNHHKFLSNKRKAKKFDKLFVHNKKFLEKKYAYSDSDEQSDGEDNETINRVVTELVRDLIKKIERTNEKSQKRPRPISSARTPQLHYSQLSLFQKLMLQEVREYKKELLFCLKLIKESNYLQEYSN
ncbi:hypothetical protein SSS_01936 [Sarcoptes scabiei]|uniref:FMR1-interacting protein 1 conserved domain-containing protein n=1 Tax=Sarcoptes scabiei TaxID=52283 RepID=A0A834R337_SARSC|nr:hypothetical protein SSS_01936 [Sarcoptes scabiei]